VNTALKATGNASKLEKIHPAYGLPRSSFVGVQSGKWAFWV